MRSCAIVQSSYIPWKGYFDLINMVDEFVLYDCVQYTRRDWRNRNRIKTPQGPAWLTVSVQAKGNYEAPIDTIQVDDARWAERHWQTLTHNYAKAPFFSMYAPGFQRTYEGLVEEKSLSQINLALIKQVCEALEITTRITDSRKYELQEDRNDRLLSICLQLGANEYHSGPSAQGYLDEKRMNDQGVSVRWMSYADYPEYTQLFPPFDHAVSILDLLFNTGPDARSYMKSFSQSNQVVAR